MNKVPLVVGKETIREDARRMERELRQLRRVAFAASNVIAMRNAIPFDLSTAIDRLDAALENYTEDKD